MHHKKENLGSADFSELPESQCKKALHGHEVNKPCDHQHIVRHAHVGHRQLKPGSCGRLQAYQGVGRWASCSVVNVGALRLDLHGRHPHPAERGKPKVIRVQPLFGYRRAYFQGRSGREVQQLT